MDSGLHWPQKVNNTVISALSSVFSVAALEHFSVMWKRLRCKHEAGRSLIKCMMWGGRELRKSVCTHAFSFLKQWDLLRK